MTCPTHMTCPAHMTCTICWFEKDDGFIEMLARRDRLVKWNPGMKILKRGDAFLFESSK